MVNIISKPTKICYYKIVCRNNSIKDLYIGQTVNLKKRISVHKHNYYRKDNKLYSFIKDNGGWFNFEFIIIEEFTCDSYKMVREREKYWIDTLKANLNSMTPIFNNFEGETNHFENISDYKERNAQQNKYKRQLEKKELLYLRNKVIELENEINKLKSNN